MKTIIFPKNEIIYLISSKNKITNKKNNKKI
jgi:hypothetical protein